MAVKDYYRLLGVEREASDEEIKKAYRKLAMAYHPDRNQNKPSCEEQLKDINEAYQVLGDEEKRRHYDFQYRWVPRDPLNPDGRRNVFDDSVNEIWTFYSGILRPHKRSACKRKEFGMRGCGRRKWHTE